MSIARLLSIFLTLCLLEPVVAQKPFNYEKAWQEADSLADQRLPKSALTAVDRIYRQAKADRQQAQLVKAVVVKGQLIMELDEAAWKKNISALTLETATAPEPVKQVLQSITAQLYWDYFQQQRWKIYERSAAPPFRQNDPDTWGVEDFHKQIAAAYRASLNNPGLLQRTPLAAYDPIILKGNTRHLRPTLYDLLAHEALDYFENAESGIARPAYAFELSEQAALAAAPLFVQHPFSGKDSSNHVLQAIRIYQELLRFHLADPQPDALIDADVKRLVFAHQQSTHPAKASLYRESLAQLYQKYPHQEQAMQAGYLLAAWWQAQGDQYQPASGQQAYKMAYVQAHEIAREVVSRFPKSEGGIQAQHLLQELEQPQLQVQAERVNTVEQPFRVLVTFKNTRTVYFRLIALPGHNETGNSQEEAGQDAWWQQWTNTRPLRAWSQVLPQVNDLRQHSAELKVDGLPSGRYLLLASNEASFTAGKGTLNATRLYVSNISFFSDHNRYYLVNRITGAPLAKASVQAWRSFYDYSSRQNIRQKGKLYTTNEQGLVQIDDAAAAGSGNLLLQISWQGDTLFMDDAISNYYYEHSQANITRQEQEDSLHWLQKHARYYVFSDRILYRPGQTLFFKAIGITRNRQNGQAQVYRPGQAQEVTLYNASNQKIDSLRLLPNAYGSISGRFKLPASGLTGVFRIEITGVPIPHGNFFRVEEYKRPKFSVAFQPVKESYRLQDTVQVWGEARAFAGQQIDGGKVSYRVYRQARMLYPWLLWERGGGWPPFEASPRMEILSGETTTGTSGRFPIRFPALPDPGVDKALMPVFDYVVEAQVTDINGESHSSSTTVSIGYHSLVLNVQVKGGLYQSSDSTVQLVTSATNLQGEPQYSRIAWQVSKLRSPDRPLRQRYWQVPDTAVYTRSEFEQLFPFDPFQREDDFRYWKKEQTLLMDTLEYPRQPLHGIRPKQLEPGFYLVEATATDKDGNPVKTITHFAIYDLASGRLPAPLMQFDAIIQDQAEPGQELAFLLGSHATSWHILSQVARPDKEGNEITSPASWLPQTKALQLFRYPITESDRGGYTIRHCFVWQNRFYSTLWQAEVPWKNKELSISLETFRNKLLPGQAETWKMKIQGYKGEKAAAELLASMYDASLDQIAPHRWHTLFPWPNYRYGSPWRWQSNFGLQAGTTKTAEWAYYFYDKSYDALMSIQGMRQLREEVYAKSTARLQAMDMQLNESVSVAAAAPGDQNKIKIRGKASTMPDAAAAGHEGSGGAAPIHIRKNFNETAFFFPDLQTDSAGQVSFSFTMPEALTQWKLQLLAHTQALQTGQATATVVTQKDLMVQPNVPRFFRQGDKLEFSAKISNLTTQELTGTARLELLSASTMQPVDGWLQNVFPQQYFTVPAGQSAAVQFPIEIPVQFTDALVYRITAQAGAYSDGEEMAVPVLSNRFLVTETLPINMRGSRQQQLRWEKLLQSGESPTLQHQSLTIEYLSNPVWLAVQALPYLMEYPYECAEQTWNRLYANTLSASITDRYPRVKTVLEQWLRDNGHAMQASLQQNQALKQVLLEETPWVLAAKTEAEQKKNIAVLYNTVRMAQETEKSLAALEQQQNIRGGFAWFRGGPDDAYITRYILAGMGHLRKLQAWPAMHQARMQTMANKGIAFADALMQEEYDRALRAKGGLGQYILSPGMIQHLYMRSFFSDVVMQAGHRKSYQFFLDKARSGWTRAGLQQQAMLALVMHRSGQTATAQAIVRSLQERSITDEEFGMYWKALNNPSHSWWQAPIETHALLLEAFAETGAKTSLINDLKTWLLKQKQTQSWASTRATAEACYALLTSGSPWLEATQSVTVQAGTWTTGNDAGEAGTGYFSSTRTGDQVKPEMGNISIRVKPDDKQDAAGISSWGAAYWQYFEDADRITASNTALQLSRRLMLQTNTAAGPKLTPIEAGTVLQPGNRLVVQVEIKTDRNLEYVHLKDMRAACLEPQEQLSRYRWQDGLGFYQSPRDASMHFFFDYLPRGTHILEYPVVVTHAGNFSQGISSIQCMYAPQFSAHHAGQRLEVKSQ